MRIEHLSLQGYRNIELQHLDLASHAHYFVGANGQGKTNLLEAMGLLTAFRSFRTSSNRVLIGWKQPIAQLAFRIHHEEFGETEVELRLEKGKRRVLIDGESAGRFSEFLGRFPTVAFSSQDIQLLRGAPEQRRRMLDLAASSIDADYLKAVRNYASALSERNALLKRNASAAELRVFEKPLAAWAAKLEMHRRSAIEALSPALETTYAAISEADEKPLLAYLPNADVESPAAFEERLNEAREKDRVLQTTSVGPHRDDIKLGLLGRRAREYASEGQQRGLVLALRLAQAEWFFARSKVRPVLLLDDILGELDPHRRERFWKAVEPEVQVFATGTELLKHNDSRGWKHWRVENGQFSPL